MIQAKIVEDIIEERHNQNKKWGQQNHSWGNWMLILGEEYGEVCEEMLNNTFGPEPDHRIKELRTELIQLCAVNLAIIEYLDRIYHE